MTEIALDYGSSGRWTATIPDSQLLWQSPGPLALEAVAPVIADSLLHPLDFPALQQALVPGDKVCLVLDRDVPSAAEIVAEIWKVCMAAAVAPQDLLILQPMSLTSGTPPDPRRLLPDRVRGDVVWRIHDPTNDNEIGYLASSADGERIYLARDVLNADVVIPVGRLGFDPVQGRRTAMSSFYPGLSNSEAFVKARGQGHSELGPDEPRPFAQRVQEIGWLLGVQFAVQVLPSSGHGGAAGVMAGNPDLLVQRGQSVLDAAWRIRIEQRGETAIVSIPTCPDEATSWEHLGHALETASRMIVRDGRIIVLSDLGRDPGPGIQLLQSCREPRAALKPLRKEAPPDLVPAAQIATAADWATVYLLSQLPAAVVESTFLTPLDSEADATRLLKSCEACVVVGGAQHAWIEAPA